MVCSKIGKSIGIAFLLLTTLPVCGGRAAAKPPVSVVSQERQGAKLLATFDSGLRVFCSVSFTPDAKRLIVDDEKGAEVVWDIIHKQRIAFHPAPKRLPEVSEDALPSPLRSPDNNSRVTVPSRYRVVLYSRSAGRKRILLIRDGEVRATAFTPDNRWLLVSAYVPAHNRFEEDGRRNTIHVVRVSNGRLTRVLEVGQYNLDALVFSRRGDQVATIQHHRVSGAEPVHGEDVVKVWDTRTWQMRFKYLTGDDVEHVQFASDARTLLVLCSHWTHSECHLNKYGLGGGQSGVLPIYDAGEAMHFGAAELSADGTRLVSMFEGHAKCQDVATGQSVTLFDREDKNVGSAPDRIALSLDSRLMADVDTKGVVTLCQMPLSSAWRKAGAGK